MHILYIVYTYVYVLDRYIYACYLRMKHELPNRMLNKPIIAILLTIRIRPLTLTKKTFLTNRYRNMNFLVLYL